MFACTMNLITSDHLVIVIRNVKTPLLNMKTFVLDNLRLNKSLNLSQSFAKFWWSLRCQKMHLLDGKNGLD